MLSISKDQLKNCTLGKIPYATIDRWLQHLKMKNDSYLQIKVNDVPV